ncbi:MAG: HAD hydrolase-like protein [Chitinivibrionales bacterium]|nr:HAD hydrolase-like protein [Chitinivibrionales bacterium]
MTDPLDTLKNYQAEHDFLICIDSDGCVFDSMEIKQKECFCPQFVNHYDLQAVSKYAREVWEFVNLYSTTRGVNRFKALVRSLELCAARSEVRARNIAVPAVPGVRAWIASESKLGNPALEVAIAHNPDPDLTTALAWSNDVNAAVAKIVRNVPPFPFVRECMDIISSRADIIVVSQTPLANLETEWKEHSIDRYAQVIAGQEMGTKKEHIEYAVRKRYDARKVLMIGDAPGDLRAAQENGVSFYPVNPGQEEGSWRQFHDEALGKFFDGTYLGDYEKKCIDTFNGYLPGAPPWS